MEWFELYKKVLPYSVRIESENGFGTGFLFTYNKNKEIAAIATAAHVMVSSHSMMKIKYIACVSAFLATVLLFSGCTMTTAITKNYEDRIWMTKSEAVQYLKHYYREAKDLSVDENHISYPYKLKIIDNRSLPHQVSGRSYEIVETYHWEDRFLNIVFANVTRIELLGRVVAIYDNKNVNLLKDMSWIEHDELISALIALCPNIDSGSWDIAAANKVYNAVIQRDLSKLKEMLVAHPELANTKTELGTPLYIAASKGYKDVAELLIDRGAKIDEKSRKIYGSVTPLYAASEMGHADVAEFLIAKGADVNTKSDKGGYFPLYTAAMNGRKNVVELLIAKGADVNAKINFFQGGKSSLYAAAVNGHKDVAELLIAKGADVNKKTSLGLFSPLYAAAENGHKTIVDILIAKGADVNTKDNHGFTPLHVSVQNGRKDVVEFLIAKGADVNIRNDKGYTALHIAYANKNEDIIKLLLRHGAVQ